MGGLRPRLLLYLFKSAKGQASERYEVYSFFYLLSTKNCVHCVANLWRSIRGNQTLGLYIYEACG